MSMIKCPECKKKISNQAKACPHCGCPIEKPKETDPQVNPTTISSPQNKKRGKGCLIFLIIFIVVPTVIGIFANLISGESIIKESTTVSDNLENSDTVLTKEDAINLDKQIWDYVYPVIVAHNDLMSIMSGYSDGAVSELDFYNATKDFYSYAQEVWGNSPSIDNEDGKAYLESCQDYIIIEQTMADSLLKYLDSKKTSDLSKVQENIERCTQAVQIVASNRGTFLGINNFTDEEIQEILDESFQ